MERAELKAKAREALAGKWGKAILLMIAYGIVIFLGEMILTWVPFIGPLALIVLTVPLTVGYTVEFMKLARGEEVNYFGFFKEGFDRFGKSWEVVGHTILKVIAPFIAYLVSVFGATMLISLGAIAGSSFMIVIGGILFIGVFASLVWLMVKTLLYSLTTYILIDNSEMSAKEVVNESAKLMLGNRMKYFVLSLSFIGWALLAILTCGIGYLWLVPYIAVTNIFFYNDLAGKKVGVVKEDEVEAEEVESDVIVEDENNPIK